MTAPAFRPTPHLDHLVVEVAALAAQLRATTPPAAVVTAARERALLATLQLDGSPIAALPDHLDVAAAPVAEVGAGAGTPAGPGSWYESFALLEETPNQHLLALEARGVKAAFDADDLIAPLTHTPRDALAELHRRLTAGLLDADRAGHPRTTEQAVQDASIGRVLYYTVHPQLVGTELDGLAAWLAGPAAQLDPLVASGLLHLEVLRIHPFEAANGRLARAAARLLLRGHGLDPDGLAGAEAELLVDRLGYHEEVARTLRRRDAAVWLERWGEAVAAGLRRAAREAALLDVEVPARAAAFLAERDPGSTFTVADLRDHLAVELAAAQAELGQLLDAGVVRRAPGGRGLRFVVT